MPCMVGWLRASTTFSPQLEMEVLTLDIVSVVIASMVDEAVHRVQDNTRSRHQVTLLVV